MALHTEAAARNEEWRVGPARLEMLQLYRRLFSIWQKDRHCKTGWKLSVEVLYNYADRTIWEVILHNAFIALELI